MNKEKITHHGKQHELEKEVVGVWGFGVECMATATLTIDNPLPFHAYLENIEGHYIKGVASWQEAHEELIDLVQAMLEELRGVAEDSSYEQKGVEQSYKAYIVEVYGDGIEIHYSCSQEQGEEIELSVFSSADIEEYLLSDEALLDLNHLR